MSSLYVTDWELLCSASVALALTSLLLVRAACPHPPACSSAMIVALGGVSSWTGVLTMLAAVIIMTALAVALNRLACLPVPIWHPRRVPFDAA